MAEAELQLVELKNDFYRDSFGKILLIIASIFVAIILLVAISIYLYLNKPKPVTFIVNADWRVQAAVPIDQPYLLTADLLQWVSDTIQKIFIYDFYHYNDQVKNASQYFTQAGWKIFLGQLNIYANYNTVLANKMFINAVPAGAPFVLQQALLSGRYAWWVQIPVDINYIAYNKSPNKQTLTLQILVVRIPTLNNLAGVSIENVIVAKNTGNPSLGGG